MAAFIPSTTEIKGNTPYALSETVDWDDVRAELNAAMFPSPVSSSSNENRGSISSQTPSTSSLSSSYSVNSWVSGSALATHLLSKKAARISSTPWRGWIPVSVFFDRVSADPKQTFNELVQKGFIVDSKFSEIHDVQRCRWVVTLDVEDVRLETESRSFKGEHRSKGGARAEAIRGLIVALIRQHTGLEFGED